MLIFYSYIRIRHFFIIIGKKNDLILVHIMSNSSKKYLHNWCVFATSIRCNIHGGGWKGLCGAENETLQSTKNFSTLSLPVRNCYAHFSAALWRRWRLSWQNAGSHKLRSIKNLISVWGTSCRTNRYSEVILARIRIDHTKLTHQHLRNQWLRPPHTEATSNIA